MCDIIRRRKQDITLQVSNESRFNDDTVVFLSGVGSHHISRAGHGRPVCSGNGTGHFFFPSQEAENNPLV